MQCESIKHCIKKSMNIRFYNARVLTMKEGEKLFEGQVWVQDEKIIYIGDGSDLDNLYKKTGLSSIVWDREIDCEGNVLMPGFKNAHTHSGMTAFRSYADDLPLQEWLTTKIFPVEDKMTGEDVYWLTKLAILEYLTTGVTAIFDMYLTPETIADACIETGMRCVLVSGLNNFSSRFDDMEDRYNKLNGYHPLISYMMGVHAEYTCSKELLERVVKVLDKYQAPIYIHLSETKTETDECIGRYGMTPTEFLDSLGFFNYGGGGYHCVHMTENDRKILKKRGLYAVTNPGSNTKLASGIADTTAMLKAGIPVAIGTDGASSNNCLDMFREMFLVTGLAKIRENDAAVMDALEVLKMATVNGAKAMHIDDADVLAEGKLADMIMIDLHQPNMQPLNHIVNNIVYSGSKQNVKMTMINGKILYENGVFHVGVSAEEIYKKANEIIARIG